MKALRITGYGPIAAHLQLMEVERPSCRDTELLIEAHAASINPIDYKLVLGDLKRIQPLTFPAPIGFDVSGTVIAVGAQVTRFRVGDQVYARATRQQPGTFAEYVALDERIVAHKPQGITHIEAASIPLVGLTTLQALRDYADAKVGQHVLIHAGSGGVGTFAIQYAKSLGLHVTTTTSSKNAAWVRHLGADVVICYDTENYLEAGQQYNIVYDTLGKSYTKDAFRVLKRGGVVVSIAGVPDRAFGARIQANPLMRLIMWFMSMPVYRLAAGREGRYYRFLTESDGPQLTEIAHLIEAGKIKPVIDRVFPFEHSIDAFAYVMEGRSRGKVVLQIKD